MYHEPVPTGMWALIIFRASSSELLLLRNGLTWHLPSGEGAITCNLELVGKRLVPWRKVQGVTVYEGILDDKPLRIPSLPLERDSSQFCTPRNALCEPLSERDRAILVLVCLSQQFRSQALRR